MAGVVVVTRRRRRRWVAAWGRLAIAIACLCAAPGPLGQVDGGMGGCPWCRPIAVAVVVARGRGVWWVAAWSLHDFSVARFCTTWGLSLNAGGQWRGARAPWRWWWAAYLRTAAAVLRRRVALRPCRCRTRQHDAGAWPTGDVACGTLCVLLCPGCGLTPSWCLLGGGVHWSRRLCRALVRDA
jgi:hypothetical protein